MFNALHSVVELFLFCQLIVTLIRSGCMLSNFAQRCAIWCYAVQLHENVPHVELCVIIGCTVWMYAKRFHAKLRYLMLHCLTWPYTMPFHPRLTHLTSHWSVSLDSVPFHVRCSVILSYPVWWLYQLLLCFAISYIPLDITLVQL